MKNKKAIFLFLLSSFILHPSAFCQFLGYTGQQTVVKTFNVPGDLINKTPKTTVPLTNYGQAGHGLQVIYTPAAAVCTTRIEASLDNTNWFTLINVPNINGNNLTQVGYGNGYYPFLRLIANANDDAGCVVSIAGGYTGYQFPIPWQATIYNAPFPALDAAVQITTRIEFPAPQILAGFSCYNPDAVNPAYLQIMDEWPGPAALGGTTILYQIMVPPDDVVVNIVPIFSGSGLWAGASTAMNGVVAVGTPLVCNFKLNLNGPFGPFLGMPNRL